MRDIAKGAEPRTVADTRLAPTTDLTSERPARDAFNQTDKAQIRGVLVREQGFLCAFCLRRIRPEDDKGVATMRIAHRTPIKIDPSQALAWKNLLGSCEGGEGSSWPEKTCDVAQKSTPLTVDPTSPGACAGLRYERRDGKRGLFITSDDPNLRKDVEDTLNLNSGDLPELREQAWLSFCDLQQRHAGGRYGKDARRGYFPTWVKREAPKLPAMLGVIEAKLR